MTRSEARKSEQLVPLDNPEYDELLPPQGIGPMDEGPQGAKGPAAKKVKAGANGKQNATASD